MDISRVQVPIALPEPHFDDEATVVSARRVVPLIRARMNDRWRKLLILLPILLAAMVCGGLGAMTVNYFERRAGAPTIAPTIDIAPSTNHTQAGSPSAESSPVAIAATGGEAETGLSERTDKSLRESATVSNPEETPARTVPAKAEESESKKKRGQSDPRQLVRQRRVQAPATPRSGQNDESKKGAGRIQDIFSGPNP